MKRAEPFLAGAVRAHSLFWLAAANVVGLWLALVLLYPAMGDSVSPLTYGRWMPLHMNWQLYGWCSLPLVGALAAWFSPAAMIGVMTKNSLPAHAFRGALWLWSVALALGGFAWLAGETSGKLFLDWSGWTRPLLPLAMCVLWAVLGSFLWWHREKFSRGALLVRASVWIALAAVPTVLFWSAGPEVYPSVNPDSGGATGASLLGSTLGIVAIFGALPAMLGVQPVQSHRAQSWWFWIFFAVSCGVFAALDHGHASHHAYGQILGLALLLGWLPLAWIYFRGFAWSPSSRPWLIAAFVWWTLLVVTGLLTFLPGVSERLKFTHALVAHAHLAMAGLVTSVHVAILNELAPARPLRGGFWLWQAGCVVHIGALFALGWQETENAGAFFRSEMWIQAIFAVRLLAGAAMMAASIGWLKEICVGMAATERRPPVSENCALR